MLQYLIAKTLYNLVWLPWQLTFRIFLHYEIIYQDKSVKNIKGPLIITANHASWIDPFIISGIFPIFSSVFPIRFAGYPKLFFNPLLGTIIFLMGTFPAQRGIALKESLKKPIEFLKNNQVVGIFPEGKRRHLGRPRKGRRGAAYLAISANCKVLPVHIDSSLSLNFKKLLLRKKHITVYVGEPFLLSSNSGDAENVNNLNQETEVIMKKMHELKNIV